MLETIAFEKSICVKGGCFSSVLHYNSERKAGDFASLLRTVAVWLPSLLADAHLFYTYTYHYQVPNDADQVERTFAKELLRIHFLPLSCSDYIPLMCIWNVLYAVFLLCIYGIAPSISSDSMMLIIHTLMSLLRNCQVPLWWTNPVQMFLSLKFWIFQVCCIVHIIYFSLFPNYFKSF